MAKSPTPKSADTLTRAIAILVEIRPIIEASRHTSWRRQMLARVDDILKEAEDAKKA